MADHEEAARLLANHGNTVNAGLQLAGVGMSCMKGNVSTPSLNSREDEEIRTYEVDKDPTKFGLSIPYDSYADSLERTLTNASLPTPLTLGIFSHWGGGKSYLMKKLLYKMKDGACSKYCSKLTQPLKPNSVHWETRLCGRSVETKEEGIGGKIIKRRATRGVVVPFFKFLIVLIVLSILICAGMSSYIVYTFVKVDNHQNLTTTTTTQPMNNLTTVEPTTTTKSKQIVKNLDNHISIPIISAAVFLGVIIILGLITMCAICCRDGTARSLKDRLHHFKLLVIMLICQAPPSPPLGDGKVEIIPVCFNAWQYVGSDNLWAAVITNLMDQTEIVFGLWKTRLYRLGRRTLVHEHNVNSLAQQNWWASTENVDSAAHELPQSRKNVMIVTEDILKMPKPIFICLISSGCTIAVVILLILIIEYNVGYNTDLDKFYVTIIQSIAGGFLGLTLISQVRNIYAIVNSLYRKQSTRIKGFIKEHKAKASREDMSAKLGFMRKIKDEVEVLFGFVRSMERLYQKKFRICLFVEDLSQLPKAQVKKILDAFSLLLSDENAPIVSVLSIDPLPILSALDQMNKETSISSIELLNRIINMKFSLPVPGKTDVDKMLEFQVKYNDLAEVTRERSYRKLLKEEEPVQYSLLELRPKQGVKPACGRPLSDSTIIMESASTFDATPNQPTSELDRGRPLMKSRSMIQDSSAISKLDPNFKLYELYLTASKIDSQTDLEREAENSLKSLTDKGFKTENVRCVLIDTFVETLRDNTALLPGSYKKINRLLNAIYLTVDIWLCQLERHGFLKVLESGCAKWKTLLMATCKELGWWLLLCELWPYRISWIIQYCSDDFHQDTKDLDLAMLWQKVLPNYNKHSGQCSLSAWSNLEHDSLIFNSAILKFSQLNGLTIRRFLPLTVNLDRSAVKIVNQRVIDFRLKKNPLINGESFEQ